MWQSSRQDNKYDPLNSKNVGAQIKNGREFVQEMHSYPGMPEEPLTRAELRKKFDRLTAALPPDRADRIFTAFLALEEVENLRTMQFS
jgi:2-methylcitrate dehydratase PrpD